MNIEYTNCKFLWGNILYRRKTHFKKLGNIRVKTDHSHPLCVCYMASPCLPCH